MTPGIAARAIMASDVEAGRPQRRHANPQSRREGGRRTRAGVASGTFGRALRSGGRSVGSAPSGGCSVGSARSDVAAPYSNRDATLPLSYTFMMVCAKRGPTDSTFTLPVWR